MGRRVLRVEPIASSMGMLTALQSSLGSRRAEASAGTGAVGGSPASLVP